MRFFSVLTLTSILSAPAFAADLGTYRPGAPYHSVIAPAADICENQCAGDAQCRGWNYVKVNPRAPGVCEFNSKPASPIQSAISISGEGAGLLAPNLSIGTTNTVRVGTAPAVRQPSTIRVGRSPDRRVVRQAVPQQIRPEQTVARLPIQNRRMQHGSLTAQQNQFRQSTGHVAPQFRNPNVIQRGFAGPQNPQIAPRSQLIQTHGAGPAQQRLLRDPRIQYQYPAHFNHNLDDSLQRQQQKAQPQQGLRQVPQGRPPVGVPIINASPQAALPKGSVNDPVTYQNAQTRAREAEIGAAYPAAQLRGISVEQAQANLFGSLNDDVSTPRPLVNLPLDQDAPIPTAQSRSTTPVFQEPLGILAGG